MGIGEAKKIVDNKHRKVSRFDKNPLETYTERENLIEQNKIDMENDSNIYSCVECRPDTELGLIAYYSSMEGVEIDSADKDFWTSQQENLNSLNSKNREYTSEYNSLFKDLVDNDEAIVEFMRRYTGENSFDKQMQEKRKALRNAQEQREGVENEQNLGISLLLAFTGNSENAKKLRNANEAVMQAKKAIKQLRDSKKKYEETISKYQAKSQIKLRKMYDLADKIEGNKIDAAEIDRASQERRDILAPQYEIVDKIKAIQDFKNSNEYMSAKTLFKANNPELCSKLDSFPKEMPHLKVSSKQPLTLASLNINEANFNELNSQVSELIGKLPKDVDINNIAQSIDNYTIQPGETISSLENSMNSLTDKNSDEYKRLEMKRDHLKLEKNVEEAKNDIEALKKEIMENPNPSQEKLQELSNKQSRLKLLEEEVSKDPYSTTLSNLNKLQELLDKQNNYQSLQNVDEISEELEQSEVATSKGNIPLYKLICESLNRRKMNGIMEYINSHNTPEKIAEKYGADKNNHKPERIHDDDDEGR